jgi:hypothetical protein
MRRREFIAFVGAGALLPLSARAQTIEEGVPDRDTASIAPGMPSVHLGDRSRSCAILRATPTASLSPTAA